jgi:hypothetical protein
VNNASKSRTMMTQRAKLRRLAFIPMCLSYEAAQPDCGPALPTWRLSRNNTQRLVQCRAAGADCQGKRQEKAPKSASLLAESSANPGILSRFRTADEPAVFSFAFG